MFFGNCHRTRFRDSFCLASVFEMTVDLLTYLLSFVVHVPPFYRILLRSVELFCVILLTNQQTNAGKKKPSRPR